MFVVGLVGLSTCLPTQHVLLGSHRCSSVCAESTQVLQGPVLLGVRAGVSFVCLPSGQDSDFAGTRCCVAGSGARQRASPSSRCPAASAGVWAHAGVSRGVWWVDRNRTSGNVSFWFCCCCRQILF